MSNSGINYSQCWEDPLLLTRALAISEDDIVLSITSGGENTLELLLEKPASITSLDMNPAQNHLFLLKLAAIEKLDRETLLSFLGVTPSSERVHTFKKILQPDLEKNTLSWWEARTDHIQSGIIHAGKFEQFLRMFRTFILPCVHSKKNIQTFLASPNLIFQQDYFRNTFNSFRWRLLFKIATSRFVLKHFARQKGMFNETKQTAIAHQYLQRLNRNLTTIHILDNYFLHYCLTGTFDSAMPRYLYPENLESIKATRNRLNVVTANIINYLKGLPDNSISKFNLSDIFEGMNDAENDEAWTQILRTAKHGSKIAYWNNLVPRTFPERYALALKENEAYGKELHSQDKVFFYGSFHVTTVIK
jgi:S-adenosylmethionine-diacylglycerol 3-amino-3-carboxypropyl transferase